MTKIDATAFSHSALSMISFLLEESAPIAARWLPEGPTEAMQVLERMCHVGLEIAALAQSAISVLSAADQTSND